MNCGFGEILIGSALHAAGFSLGRAIAVSLIAPALYLVYALPAAYLGTRTPPTACSSCPQAPFRLGGFPQPAISG